MSAASVTGVGLGSANKAGQKANPNAWLATDRLIGPRIIYSGSVTLSGGTASVVFPQTLPGVAGDYVVFATAIAHAYASSLTTSGFTMNGTSTQTVSWILVRHYGATVSGGPTNTAV